MRLLRVVPRRRGVIGVGACALVALACTILNLCTVSLLPPKIAPRDLRNAGAEAHVLIERQPRLVDDRRANSQDFDSLDRHATTFASMMTSEVVLDDVAQQLGDPADRARWLSADHHERARRFHAA